MDRRGDAEFRRLIEALMHRGWYRQGESRQPADPHQPCWEFRAGHTLDDPTAPRRCISANNEMSAMRSLLHELEQPVGAGRAASRSESSGIGS